jgi:hypothetical protein|tara:strand:- start:2274 stop:2450 length:177 start_codon:yes stop_codon:yes gene_type:complete
MMGASGFGELGDKLQESELAIRTILTALRTRRLDRMISEEKKHDRTDCLETSRLSRPG